MLYEPCLVLLGPPSQFLRMQQWIPVSIEEWSERKKIFVPALMVRQSGIENKHSVMPFHSEHFFYLDSRANQLGIFCNRKKKNAELLEEDYFYSREKKDWPE